MTHPADPFDLPIQGSPSKARQIAGLLSLAGDAMLSEFVRHLLQAGGHPLNSGNWTRLPKIVSYKKRTSDPAMVEMSDFSLF
ncbi:hypothetical protein [Granulicella mallensis]|uniref:hypothetical protein n=1 Tax=Granulicella mallensis TaxID=940614 RepID=UPI0012371F1C|nr:hypothetical protein [Granulicella mallensis]